LSTYSTTFIVHEGKPAEVIFAGSVDILKSWILDPFEVETPDQIPEPMLREMCKFTVQQTLDRMTADDSSLIITEETGIQATFEPENLNPELRQALRPAFDPNLLDPDFSPVTFSIIEESPHPTDATIILGRKVLEYTLMPHSLAS
jgi:hypothetical protein